MIKAKVTKTDRRHNGHNIMKYIVEPDWGLGTSKDDRICWFKDMRAWLWENYGPGCELKHVMLTFNKTPDVLVCPEDPSINSVERWAWDTEFGHMRLYLKSDAELTFFNLKFVG